MYKIATHNVYFNYDLSLCQVYAGTVKIHLKATYEGIMRVDAHA